MEELNQYIYNLLNVSAITSIATGGIWPLLADQEVETFITYALSYDRSLSKDNRASNQLAISCYAASYKTALQMHDAVEAVLLSNRFHLDSISAEYIDENKETVVVSTFTVKRSINY